jgi:DNA-binding transcriptional ArsR family regulator
MTPHHTLPDEVVELIARRFRLLGDPTRIKLLNRLRDGEADTHELCAIVGSTQQNVSKHLAVLADAGIVARRRDGNVIRYRVDDDSVYRLCEELCGTMEQQAEHLRIAFSLTHSAA